MCLLCRLEYVPVQSLPVEGVPATNHLRTFRTRHLYRCALMNELSHIEALSSHPLDSPDNNFVAG